MALVICGTLDRWFPTFFHLRTPWQPTSINCTVHISSASNNVQLISQLLTCILSYTVDVCAFSRHYSFFFRVPLNVLVCTPGGTRTPGWESLPSTMGESGHQVTLRETQNGNDINLG